MYVTKHYFLLSHTHTFVSKKQKKKVNFLFTYKRAGSSFLLAKLHLFSSLK
ncbi:hypothetical protein Hanom_Chr03g00201481 [Helianthus anomalus]